jgi:hypothetical protein
MYCYGHSSTTLHATEFAVGCACVRARTHRKSRDFSVSAERSERSSYETKNRKTRLGQVGPHPECSRASSPAGTSRMLLQYTPITYFWSSFRNGHINVRALSLRPTERNYVWNFNTGQQALNLLYSVKASHIWISPIAMLWNPCARAPFLQPGIRKDEGHSRQHRMVCHLCLLPNSISCV